MNIQKTNILFDIFCPILYQFKQNNGIIFLKYSKLRGKNMNQVNEFLNYTKEDLTFKAYKNEGLNGICTYPAMMIDEMQKLIVKDLLTTIESKKKVLLDCFHGAGTSLLIGNELGMDVIGFDINPLANLITKVKLNRYDDSLDKDTKTLFGYLETDGVVTLHKFPKIEKWFKLEIIESLSRIKTAISMITKYENRCFFWVIFSNIVRKYSNSRPSTFKLHIKTEEMIENMEDNCISDFKKMVTEAKAKLKRGNCKTKVLIECGDSLELLNEVKNNSVDIVCTSPPYGDNQTTVTYGQFSSLALRWIDKIDLHESTEVVDRTFSSIDYLSLGGSKKSDEIKLNCVNKYLKTIDTDKQQKVKNFVIDYKQIFDKLSSKIKKGGYLVFTVGNRRVDDKLFPFVAVNDELASQNGLIRVKELQRDILNKRMAQKVSKVNDQAVNSMSEEYILIYRKDN